MRNVFLEPNLEAKFNEDGYVVVPFLNDLEVSDLETTYFQLRRESDLNTGWHATIHSSIPEYKLKVSKAICDVFTPKASGLFNQYKEIFANFTVKEPSTEDSAFDLHMDWSMVDEKIFTSLTLWVPLIDITDDNGYFWVLPGSHKMGYTIRGGPALKTWSEKIFDEDAKPSFERKILKLKAGEALIYDHRLIHGSPANVSEGIRIAVKYTMVPSETESVHYHFHNESEVEAFEVGPLFYNTHPIKEYPTGFKSLGRTKIQGGAFLDNWDINSLCS